MRRTGLGPTTVREFRPSDEGEKQDLVVQEEPLEIRVGYGPQGQREQTSVAVTMRTPGHDLELASGFLFTEGIINDAEDLLRVEYCDDVGKQEERENVVRAELTEGIDLALDKLSRNFFVSSSCGVCGKASIDAIHQDCIALSDGPNVGRDVLYNLVGEMEERQRLFGVTGGLHAAGLFSTAGELSALREDVGRHNAVDKLVGAALQARLLPLSESILLLSGRAGFELIQKAIRAGIPLVAAVGAPTSLSVELAKQFNLTLIGFLRDQKFNVYSGEQRIS